MKEKPQRYAFIILIVTLLLATLIGLIYVVSNNILIRKPPEESSNTKLWKMLRTARDNGCETKPETDEYVYTLTEEPTITLPSEDHYIYLTSLRNLAGSSSALDIINSKGEIVNTIYELGFFAVSPDSKNIVFIGKYDTNCKDSETQPGVLNVSTDTFIPLDVSMFDEELSYSLSWSTNGTYVIAAQTEKNNKKIYKIVMYSGADYSEKKEITLAEGFFGGPCGSVCEVPAVIYNEDEEKFFLNLYREDYESLEDVDILLKNTYVYTSDGTFVEKKDGVTIRESSDGSCQTVKYDTGGTSLFCQY